MPGKITTRSETRAQAQLDSKPYENTRSRISARQASCPSTLDGYCFGSYRLSEYPLNEQNDDAVFGSSGTTKMRSGAYDVLCTQYRVRGTNRTDGDIYGGYPYLSPSDVIVSPLYQPNTNNSCSYNPNASQYYSWSGRSTAKVPSNYGDWRVPCYPVGGIQCGSLDPLNLLWDEHRIRALSSKAITPSHSVIASTSHQISLTAKPPETTSHKDIEPTSSAGLITAAGTSLASIVSTAILPTPTPVIANAAPALTFTHGALIGGAIGSLAVVAAGVFAGYKVLSKIKRDNSVGLESTRGTPLERKDPPPSYEDAIGENKK